MAVSGLTALVIRALGLLVGKMVKDDRGMADVADVKTVTGVNTMRRCIATETITLAAQALVETHELDYDVAYVTSRRVGRTLKKMRLQQSRIGKASKRGWVISLDDVIRWANSYGLQPCEITGIDPLPHPTNARNGSNVGNVGQPTTFQWSGEL